MELEENFHRTTQSKRHETKLTWIRTYNETQNNQHATRKISTGLRKRYEKLNVMELTASLYCF